MKTFHFKAGFWIFLVLLAPIVTMGQFTANDAVFAAPTSPEVQEVLAKVEKIDSAAVFFETDTGAQRNLSVKKIKREMIASLKPGDLVILKINKDNQIVDVQKSEEPFPGPSEGFDMPD